MYKIGKVYEFDNFCGRIVDETNVYTFVDKDLVDSINVGDIVTFRAELINGEYKAFFIRKYITKSII